EVDSRGAMMTPKGNPAACHQHPGQASAGKSIGVEETIVGDRRRRDVDYPSVRPSVRYQQPVELYVLRLAVYEEVYVPALKADGLGRAPDYVGGGAQKALWACRYPAHHASIEADASHEEEVPVTSLTDIEQVILAVGKDAQGVIKLPG